MLLLLTIIFYPSFLGMHYTLPTTNDSNDIIKEVDIFVVIGYVDKGRQIYEYAYDMLNSTTKVSGIDAGLLGNLSRYIDVTGTRIVKRGKNIKHANNKNEYPKLKGLITAIRFFGGGAYSGRGGGKRGRGKRRRHKRKGGKKGNGTRSSKRKSELNGHSRITKLTDTAKMIRRAAIHPSIHSSSKISLLLVDDYQPGEKSYKATEWTSEVNSRILYGGLIFGGVVIGSIFATALMMEGTADGLAISVAEVATDVIENSDFDSDLDIPELEEVDVPNRVIREGEFYNRILPRNWEVTNPTDQLAVYDIPEMDVDTTIGQDVLRDITNTIRPLSNSASSQTDIAQSLSSQPMSSLYDLGTEDVQNLRESLHDILGSRPM